jgi:hypothetical protein
VRFLRDVDEDLYIEIPGKPGWFASAMDFQKGKKYVERHSYDLAEIESDGPAEIEWEIKERQS